MDKKIAGMIGAVAALVTIDGAGATTRTPDPAELLRPASYAELLTPVSNASDLLRAIDDRQGDERTKVAQYYNDDHHHHHHNRYRRVPPVLRQFIPHHHHHHQRYRRDWDE